MGESVSPGSGVIGILGGGQLGRMMALAARELGLGTVVWDPELHGPASQAADAEMNEPYDSPRALASFVHRVQRVTYEFENIPADMASNIAQMRPLAPGAELLYVSQNRLREKERARRAGLQTVGYRAVGDMGDLQSAVAELGLPGILKTVSGGYDGKGQYRLLTLDDVLGLSPLVGSDSFIYEQMVSFACEVSVLVARDVFGQTVTYPVTENIHQNGILHKSLAPARVAPEVSRDARQSACRLAQDLGLVGVMAVEFFVTHDGQVLFNEMAPRPHNSGHWTIEGAFPSQFTQHMRAVAGWSVAEPKLLTPCVMINLLGDLFGEGCAALVPTLAVDGVQFHWYGKKEMRAGRKVGHLTALGDSVKEADQRAEEALAILREGQKNGS